MATKKKSSFAVVQERVLELMPLISRMDYQEILRYVAINTNWNINTRQIDNYIAKAKEAMKDHYKDVKDGIREQSLNNLKNLYNDSHSVGDFKNCLAIQKEIDDLFGIRIKESTNIEVNVNTEKTITEEMTAEDASRMYSEALKGE